MTDFNPFDNLIIMITVISLVIGFARGLAREILTLTGWGGALYIYNSYAQTILQQTGLSDLLNSIHPIAGKVVLSICLYFFFGFITKRTGKMIRNLLKDWGVGMIDRVLGGALGILRGFMIIALLKGFLVDTAAHFNIKLRGVDSSKLLPVAERVGLASIPLFRMLQLSYLQTPPAESEQQ